MKRQAIAVASGCLQAGMHLVNPEILGSMSRGAMPSFADAYSPDEIAAVAGKLAAMTVAERAALPRRGVGCDVGDERDEAVDQLKTSGPAA
jgi:hypothetical protein